MIDLGLVFECGSQMWVWEDGGCGGGFRGRTLSGTSHRGWSASVIRILRRSSSSKLCSQTYD